MIDNKDIFKFSGFVLNAARRELKEAGELIEIEPRAFEVLLYLVKNRERAVDKDELQDVIWPGMVVTETALTRAVMKARKAVGDDATRQAMIKTLHGHGYRFIAKISVEEPVAPPQPAEAEPARQTGAEHTRPTTSRFRSLVLIAVAIVLVAGLTWVLLRPQIATPGESRIAILPLLDNTNNRELAWTSFGLMSYAGKLISNDNSMPVVPAGSVIGLAENFGWNGDLANPVNDELLEKLKQVYGATHVLAMELETEGTALRMNYGLQTPDGDLHRGTIVGDDGTDLAQGVVQAVYGNIFRRSHVGGDIPLVSKDSFNNEAFARGMDLSLQGRCSEAVQFFRVIIELEPSLFAPRYELAACLRILGQPQEAEALLDTLIEEQRPLGASRQLAESLMTLGVLYNRTGRLDMSESAHTEALQIAESLEEHVLSARILQNLSIVYKSRSNLEEASRHLDLALLAYQDAGMESLPGQLYSGRANLDMARGELVEAELELGKALAAFREIGDRRNEAMMLNNTGYLRRRQGRIEEAEAYHLRSLEIREEIGDRVGVGRIYGMLSGIYSAQGHYENAISAAESAREIARETSDRLFEATSLAQLANAEESLGNVEAARQHYLEGRAIFVEIQDLQRTLQTDLKIARIDLSQERIDQAEKLVLQVLEESRKEEIMTTEVESMELIGDLAVTREDRPAAISEYRKTLQRLEESTWVSKVNTVKVKLANVYMDEGDMEATAPLMGALAAGSPNVPSLKAQARFAFERGDAGAALELMTRAKKLAGKHWADKSEATFKLYLDAQNQKISQERKSE